ncbi:hypothetical protein RHGRI_012414 [Rhododendron griersonianum]|uniref:F-box protein n=1 Tax=Rhododendron griersonianum TaxID=479676 RepID=A0AAV6KRU1_9ERIC|nr:hypothetical protein RHGRI_012414 [Rhododendron griersonianum]
MRKKEIGGTEEVEMPRFEILGSCRGLLLIRRDMDYFPPVVNRPYMDFYLWNPSIRQCTKVLSLPQRYPWDKDIRYERPMTGCGLCYDSSTDEYKAVMAYKRCDTYDACTGLAVVASLKSKHWTSYCFPYQLESGPVVNERLHWVVKRDENGTRFPAQQIVCFDPLVDEFVESSTPPSYDGDRNVILENGKVLVAVNVKQILVYNPSEDSRRQITSPTNIFAYEESLVSPDSCGGGNDWRIERVDAWNYVYSDDSDDDSDRGRQKYGWCPCCRAYDPSQWDSMYDWEVDGDYDWEEDFLKKEKQRHRYITSSIKKSVIDVFSYEESLVSPESYGGGNDWRVERVDSWNLVYDCGCGCWCDRCIDILSLYGSSNSDWEEDDDDMTYDWEEEDFLNKEKEQHRMRI